MVGELRIARLRAASGPDPDHAARLVRRIEASLSPLDAGEPVVCLRRVRLTHAAEVAAAPLWRPAAALRAAERATRQLIAQARSPWREAVSPEAGAVRFADTAEWLAAAALDALQGRLDRWWWVSLPEPGEAGVRAAWRAHPRAVPVALALLAARGAALPFAARLGDAAATLHEVLCDTYRLAPARDWQVAPASLMAAIVPEALPGASTPPLAPAARQWLALGLGLARAPAALGRVLHTATAPPGSAAAGGPDVPGLPQTGPDTAPAAAAVAAGAPDTPPAGPAGRGRAPVGTPVTAPGLPLPPGPAGRWRAATARPTPGGGLQATAWRAPSPGPAAPGRRPAAPRPPAARHGLPRQPATGASASTLPPDPRAAARPAPPGALAAVPDGGAPGWPAAWVVPLAGVAAPELPWSAACHTRFAGLFHLINVCVVLGLYPDFTQPGARGIALHPWDALALLGERLIGVALHRDPLWAWLARAAGRPDTALPGLWAPPPEPDWCLPPDWLAPWAADTAGRWTRCEDNARHALWHPQAFCVADLPRDRALPAQDEAGHAAIPDPRRAPAALRSWGDWADRLAPYLRARLARATGLSRHAALHAVLGRAGSVLHQGERLEVACALAELPLPVRLAGLDRDLGWLPAAGCALHYRFE